MPYYRKRRTYKKRRSTRKGYWKRKVRKSTMGQTGKRFFKLKRVYPLTTSSGLISFTDNPRNISAAQDYSNVAGLFDTYRCCAVKYKFIPAFPYDTSVTTNYTPLYVTFDTDGTGPSTINAALQYENLKLKNMYRPWTVYYKLPKISTSGAIMGYCDIDSPSTVGEVTFLASGLNTTATYGQLIQTYYVVVRDRK